MKLPVSLSAITMAMLLIQGCDSPSKEGAAVTGEVIEIDFVSDVRPVLEKHCIRCHNDEQLLGGLNLMNRAAMSRGSKNGPVLVPGHPDESLLFNATSLEHGKNAKAMPATGPVLTPEEKEVIRIWIETGADWPEGDAGMLVPIKATNPAA